MLTVSARFTGNAGGFSLIEMAVVLMILGTLLSGVLVAVGQTTESTRRTNALAQLRMIEDALYGYAQSTGRLPCPATAASLGREAPVGGGVCTAWHGFVPASTLGISGTVNTDGLLLDPWQNPVRYSVASTSNPGGRAFTSAAGLSYHYNNSLLTADATMLRLCDNTLCSSVILADTAPAVVLTMGANWASYTSAQEQANAGDGTSTLVNGGNTYRVDNDNDFLTTSYSEDNFDDQLIWLSPHLLFNRLISAGKLP